MRRFAILWLLAACEEHLCDDEPSYCTDKVVHTCNPEPGNMRWETATCTNFCIELGTEAFCATEDTPRAACMGVERDTLVCDGAQQLKCRPGGYAVVLQTCSSADRCRTDNEWDCRSR